MTDGLQRQTLEAFLSALASKAPAPGGGSVAALTGAMAAGLISMVCAIMLEREKGRAASDDPASSPNGADDTQTLWRRAEELRQELQRLAEADVAVFERLSGVYKLPRTTEADAASRRAAIQKVTRQATDVPLRTARAAAELLPLCIALANRCSRMLASDVGVAATLARAAIQSSLLNIEINLISLEDQNYVRQVRAQIEDLAVGLPEETNGVLQIVLARIRQ